MVKAVVNGVQLATCSGDIRVHFSFDLVQQLGGKFSFSYPWLIRNHDDQQAETIELRDCFAYSRQQFELIRVGRRVLRPKIRIEEHPIDYAITVNEHRTASQLSVRISG